MTKKQRTILWLFGCLAAFCAALAIGGDFLSPFTGSMISTAGVEGLKATIAAFIGALSALMGGKDEGKSR